MVFVCSQLPTQTNVGNESIQELYNEQLTVTPGVEPGTSGANSTCLLLAGRLVGVKLRRGLLALGVILRSPRRVSSGVPGRGDFSDSEKYDILGL